jgi:hypothetical protein
MVKSNQPIILREYTRIKSAFEFHLLGLVEIGSHAWGEAISTSDHDNRLVICSAEPYVLLKEHAWTKGPSVEVTYVEWADLNRSEEVSFGITNLAFVERCLQAGCFPLNDHTALYQGQILADEEGAIQRFRDQYAGTAFANIVEDYLRQTAWRVNHKLRAEAEFMTLGQQLDRRKLAIPAMHTCCRIVRDIANIDTYRSYMKYLGNSAALDVYYQTHWPWFYPTFRALFDYKRDEARRRTLFEQVERRDLGCLENLQQLQAQTILLWQHFNESVL